MSVKRPSLAESMRQAAQSEEPVSPAATPVAQVSAPRSSEPRPDRPAGFYAATRAGKKKVTAALTPTLHKQLKGLAVAKDTTTEALLLEAIGDLMVKHGLNHAA
jgi:hypothetical protein